MRRVLLLVFLLLSLLSTEIIVVVLVVVVVVIELVTIVVVFGVVTVAVLVVTLKQYCYKYTRMVIYVNSYVHRLATHQRINKLIVRYLISVCSAYQRRRLLRR